MKNTLLLIIATLLLSVAAHAEIIDGINYNLCTSCGENNTNTATVTALPDNAKYSGDIVIPATVEFEGNTYGVVSIEYGAFRECNLLTSVVISEGVSHIGDEAFWNCSLLSSVTIPDGITSFEYGTFYNCSSLTSVTIPDGVTSIGNSAFSGCSSLTSVTIPDGVTSIGYQAFYYCSSLTSVTIPESVTSISDYAFDGCSSLTSLTIPDGVTSIGSNAFYNCSSLTITIPTSVNSLGRNCLYNVREVIMAGSVPPTVNEALGIKANGIIKVPESAYQAYSTAPVWKNYLHQIVPNNNEINSKSVTITASESTSALFEALGETALLFITDLKITGTINSYDFMILNNKTINLQHLDLSEASIVYNAYEHRTDCHTEDNKLPAEAFYGHQRLCTIKLPDNITEIGREAFQYCSSLCNVEMSKSNITTIGSSAFYDCDNLRYIALPNSVTSIESSAFYSSSLDSIALPNGLVSISDWDFAYCYNLKQIKLPPTVKTIGSYAFQNCNSLKSLRIPSSVQSIGNEAFSDCPFDSVYTYTVEPINIQQNTFSCYDKAVLCVPKQSYYTYYFNTQWSQFLKLAEFDEPYDYFYVNGDYTIDDNTGNFDGDPDVEVGEGGGVIVDGDGNQGLGDVTVDNDGEGNGGSVITGDNVTANSLTVRINITQNKWYFFGFPFNVALKDITFEPSNGKDAQWLFRYYDGEKRAEQGYGGWTDLPAETDSLLRGHGYIFMASATGKLYIKVPKPKFSAEDIFVKLTQFVSDNLQNAGWNLVGNPHLSYFDIAKTGYTSPITIWEDYKYISLNPLDDDYRLHPLQAFFVQVPAGVDGINYPESERETQKGTQRSNAEEKQNIDRRMLNAAQERYLINIEIASATHTDATRVVYNNAASDDFDPANDATKMLTDGVIQIYTMDARQNIYSINERPDLPADVVLGYAAPAAGEYTISITRQDVPVMIEDLTTGRIIDMSETDSFTFTTEAGTYNGRFIIRRAPETPTDTPQLSDCGITVHTTADGLVITGLTDKAEIFTVDGKHISTVTTDGLCPLPAGVYVVTADGAANQFVVR